MAVNGDRDAKGHFLKGHKVKRMTAKTKARIIAEAESYGKVKGEQKAHQTKDIADSIREHIGKIIDGFASNPVDIALYAGLAYTSYNMFGHGTHSVTVKVPEQVNVPYEVYTPGVAIWKPTGVSITSLLSSGMKREDIFTHPENIFTGTLKETFYKTVPAHEVVKTQEWSNPMAALIGPVALKLATTPSAGLTSVSQIAGCAMLATMGIIGVTPEITAAVDTVANSLGGSLYPSDIIGNALQKLLQGFVK